VKSIYTLHTLYELFPLVKESKFCFQVSPLSQHSSAKYNDLKQNEICDPDEAVTTDCHTAPCLVAPYGAVLFRNVRVPIS
jgi:hypothetical protein